MAHVSLYRKYRSQTFSDLIGQDHVVRTLQNAIQTGRIAHAYLFTGPRGTGKTSSARLLAKSLCCESGPSAEPCNTCELCTSITSGSAMDVTEMDAASESGVDDIRETIVQAVDYRPALARYRIFIIDEVHDLSPKAFDALLKTIEEPPDHIVFILATTEYHKVPPTIRSRCQKFEFHRAAMADLVSLLENVVRDEQIEAEPAALSAIARMADGGYRDALTLLEQAVLTADGKVTLQAVYDQLGLIGEEAADDLLLAIRHSKVERIIGVSTELTRLGRDPRSILESLLYRLADLTRASYGIEAGAGDGARDASMHETAAKLGQSQILTMRSELAEAHKVIRDITLPRLWLESELIRISLLLHVPKQAASAVAAEPVKPSPETAPAPVAKPAPVASPVAESAPVETEKVQVAEPTTSQSDPAQALWSQVYNLLPEGIPMRMKLADSRATELTESHLVIEVRGQMIADWMADDPRRIGYVVTFLQKLKSNVQPKFVAAKNGKRPAPEATAVELPLEGKALHDAASEILRGS